MPTMTHPQYRRRECTVDGRCVRMGPAETEMLAFLLVSQPDRFLNLETLIEALWPNPDFEPDWAAAIVWRRIHTLRRHGIDIENVYSFGWRIPRQAREAQTFAVAA